MCFLSWCIVVLRHKIQFGWHNVIWCYGKALKRKRSNTGTEKNGNPPQNLFFEGIPTLFDWFPWIPVFTGQIFLRDFPKFSISFRIFLVRFRCPEKLKIFSLLIGFLFFSICFRKFLIRFRFSKKVINFQFVGRFFFLFRSVSAYFYSISCFQKSY